MSGRLAGYAWVDNPYRGSNGYAASDYYNYLPIILLHMTVGMGLSAGYVASHSVPPHLWANPYNFDKFQTQDLDLAAKALYQPQFGYHWTNKHAFLLQTELVGVPQVSVATYSREQCRWIAKEVVVPQVRWLRERGLNINIDDFRYHENTSGSASEYWSGRMSEQQMADFNGIMCHIDAWGNDHWDCSAERIDWIAQDTKEILGDTTPIKRRKLQMYGRYRMDPTDRSKRVTVGDGQIGTAEIIDLIGKSGGKVSHHPADGGQSSYVKLVFKGKTVKEGYSKWNMAVEWTLPDNIPDADGHTTSPGLVSVLVKQGVEYIVVYEGP